MRSALLGIVIGLGIAALAVTGSCSISHKSDEYACTTNNDCREFAGRVCSDGFCILPGTIDAPHSDAPKNPDGNNCPAPCTSCNVAQHSCTIDCSLTQACNNQVNCPAGYHCDFQCKTDNSCRNGVNCLMAASCTLECSGKQACAGVQCGSGPCDVSCSGPSSCRNVACNTSCACDVTCTGSSSCTDAISCQSTTCQSGSGCTSVPLFCHSC
jgi:hypothetical protein